MMYCRWLIVLVLVAHVAGCEYDDEDDARGGRIYQPPPGLGAIVVENYSTAEWNVVVDGAPLGQVAAGSYSVHNSTPGPHRVHLDEHLGSEVEDLAVQVKDGFLEVVWVDGDPFDYDAGQFSIDP